MRTVGIVAEYNPFHSGHAYHISEAKKRAQADYVVVVMSPDFVQRGEPAIFDKYVRAHMALLGGADLVLELPVCYAAGSAEYFAEGAVALLERLGVVDALCFGAEQADPELFRTAAAVLADEPPEYKETLSALLRLGKTFPQARGEALARYLFGQDPAGSSRIRETHRPPTDCSPEDIPAFLSRPNNILGVEYCKALRRLHSSIRPLPIPRKGSRYDSPSLDGPYCSAAAIRSGIGEGCESGVLLRHIPDSCRDLFSDALPYAVTLQELLPFLVQKLLSLNSYDSVFDLSPDLSDRIRSLRYACIGKSYGGIVALLKSRQVTEAYVRRALLHLILDLRGDDIQAFRAHGGVFYAKVLGLRRAASPLLHRIRESCTVPFLVKPAHADKTLEGCAARMWRQDLFASHLYRSIQVSKGQKDFHSEYEISPLIL